MGNTSSRGIFFWLNKNHRKGLKVFTLYIGIEGKMTTRIQVRYTWPVTVDDKVLSVVFTVELDDGDGAEELYSLISAGLCEQLHPVTNRVGLVHSNYKLELRAGVWDWFLFDLEWIDDEWCWFENVGYLNDVLTKKLFECGAGS